MWRVLLDQNFDHRILDGLLKRVPQLDYLTAHQAGWSQLSDPDLLIEAAKAQRVLLTHDLQTMPRHIADVMISGHDIAGVFIVPSSLTLAQAIDELELIVTGSEQADWFNTYRILPL